MGGQGFVGEASRKELIRRPRRRWEENIKMNLKEIGCEDVDWIDLP